MKVRRIQSISLFMVFMAVFIGLIVASDVVKVAKGDKNSKKKGKAITNEILKKYHKKGDISTSRITTEAKQKKLAINGNTRDQNSKWFKNDLSGAELVVRDETKSAFESYQEAKKKYNIALDNWRAAQRTYQSARGTKYEKKMLEKLKRAERALKDAQDLYNSDLIYFQKKLRRAYRIGILSPRMAASYRREQRERKLPKEGTSKEIQGVGE